MTTYKITSSAGQDMGTYDADTERGALDAMAREAGYASQAEAAEVAGAFEGRVEAVDLYPTTRTEDGGIRYWAVYAQTWRTVRAQSEIGEREWAAHTEEDRVMFRELPAEPVETTDDE